MAMNILDAQILRKMFLTGARNLEIKKEWINQLNVFPVPDGDTGTNMTLTIMSAAGEVAALGEDATIDELAKAISGGSLRGARGNSGVILSQLFRGFTKTIMDHSELDKQLIAAGFVRAVETAYKAVMKPKEGTILTVAKSMSVKAEELAEGDEELIDFFRLILQEGQETLERTPEMLPVLKEAGVVDSGGQGLMTILEGCLDAFEGKELDLDFELPAAAAPVQTAGAQQSISTDDIKFGYCTEFIINLEREFTEKDEEEMKDFLTSFGDSLVLVADDEIVKIHVHTNHPGRVFEKGLEYGNLCRMKIDNMRIEHQEKLFRESEVAAAKAAEAEKQKNEPLKKNGFVSVTIGEGMSEIFKGLGVNYLIEGGQTMNPSTDDMLKAIEEAHAENVYILPNNKNVILAANQARDLVEDVNVIVVGSKTIPQGISAMISFSEDKTPEQNLEDMTEALNSVKTCEVTYAVRDTKIDGVEIHDGDIMAIGDKGILAVGTDINEVVMQALDKLVDDDSEIISIYNGAEFSDEDAEALADRIGDRFEDVDVEANYGGQPIYYCIISVE
ncbi:MAG: DAK2 domain-containing protein [Lachnospiraceae bacterium]|nr:DAK2 domain-containing protein [Lachnospiraceae bacterium]